MDIKCLTKAPGHIPSPEHLRCTLAFCRNKRCSSKTHFLIWCFDDDGGDRCNTMVHMLKDFRIAKASHYDSHRFCAVELSKSVNPLRQRTLTQSDTPYICPILDFLRIIHHRMKRSTRTILHFDTSLSAGFKMPSAVKQIPQMTNTVKSCPWHCFSCHNSSGQSFSFNLSPIRTIITSSR